MNEYKKENKKNVYKTVRFAGKISRRISFTQCVLNSEKFLFQLKKSNTRQSQLHTKTEKQPHIKTLKIMKLIFYYFLDVLGVEVGFPNGRVDSLDIRIQRISSLTE